MSSSITTLESQVSIAAAPHTVLSAQLLWLRSVLALVDVLSTHFRLSCFILTISLSADFDCGVPFADLALARRSDFWHLQMGPTSSALYDNAGCASVSVRWASFHRPSPASHPLARYRPALAIKSTPASIMFLKTASLSMLLPCLQLLLYHSRSLSPIL